VIPHTDLRQVEELGYFGQIQAKKALATFLLLWACMYLPNERPR
jgi:hypothetical protein